MAKSMPKSGHKEAPVGVSKGPGMGGKIGNAGAMHGAGKTKETFQESRMGKLAKKGASKK